MRIVLRAQHRRALSVQRTRVDAFRPSISSRTPVGPHGGEVGAARDKAYLGVRSRKLGTEKAADCAGAKDADLQNFS